MRARQPALRRPVQPVLVLEAGRPDWSWDVFIHMPAALAFPIGSRFYDWRYESEPEPYMGGRRVFHARGKVLGGSSSINGMIFQRGNPMDYERWASGDGMETWDYHHCLPYFKRMENCLAAAADDPWRGHDGPLVLERGPARGPALRRLLRGRPAGRLSAHRRRQRVQAGGLREVRPQRPQGAAAVRRARATCTRSSTARTSRSRRSRSPRRSCSRAAGPSASSTRGRRSHQARGGEVILCGGAINTPQLMQISGIGAPDHLRSIGVDVVHELPGVGEPAGPPRGLRPAHLEAADLDGALLQDGQPAEGRAPSGSAQVGSGCDQPLRGGRLHSQQRRGRMAEPHVPLPADRDPLRRHRPRGRRRARLPGARRSDVLGRARHLPGRLERPAQAPGAALQLPLDRQRPARVDRGAPGDPQDPLPAGWDGIDGGELSPGAEVETDEEILDWVAKDAETALHPSCTCRMGTDDLSVTDPTTMRRARRRGLRVVDASVFPYVTNGNIYAPVMMTAEKAADLILGNTPLPPEMTEYYRHPLAEPGDVRDQRRLGVGRGRDPGGGGDAVVDEAVAFVLAATDRHRTRAEALLEAHPGIEADPWARLVLGRGWDRRPERARWTARLGAARLRHALVLRIAGLARELLERGADPNWFFVSEYGRMSALYGAAGRLTTRS